MTPFLLAASALPLPTFCPTCGDLRLDGTPCDHPEALLDPPTADPVLQALLDEALPLDEASRNLRNVIRGEGLDATRAQLAQLVDALTLDLQAACAQTLTHAHLPADTVRDAVRGHITNLVLRSGEAQA